MGLGYKPDEAADYEWVRLADLPAPARAAATGPAPLTDAVSAWLRRHRVWSGRGGPRVLLVDLDNLRAAPVRWKARMAVVVALAELADHVALAGQHAAVRRARPHLGRWAAQARGVAEGSDLADHVLLDAAAQVPGARPRFVVLSNDFIFAGLAARGRLTVISPGGDALSGRLVDAAARVVDLAELEAEVAAAHPLPRRGPRGAH